MVSLECASSVKELWERYRHTAANTHQNNAHVSSSSSSSSSSSLTPPTFEAFLAQGSGFPPLREFCAKISAALCVSFGVLPRKPSLEKYAVFLVRALFCADLILLLLVFFFPFVCCSSFLSLLRLAYVYINAYVYVHIHKQSIWMRR